MCSELELNVRQEPGSWASRICATVTLAAPNSHLWSLLLALQATSPTATVCPVMARDLPRHWLVPDCAKSFPPPWPRPAILVIFQRCAAGWWMGHCACGLLCTTTQSKAKSYAPVPAPLCRCRSYSVSSIVTLGGGSGW
jgi:hypothetical protein